MARVQDGKSYVIMNAGSKTCVNLFHGSAASNTKVVGMDFHIAQPQDAGVQVWKAKFSDTRNGLDYYTLINRAGKTAMDITRGGNHANGNRIVGYEPEPAPPGPDQKWYFRLVSGTGEGPLCYKIFNGVQTDGSDGGPESEPLCLDLQDGSAADETPIQLWRDVRGDTNTHQLWTLIEVGSRD